MSTPPRATKTLRMLLVDIRRKLIHNAAIFHISKMILILYSTRNNPNVSQEAKDNAEAKLKELGQNEGTT